MAFFLKSFIVILLLSFTSAQLYSGWNFGRYYATAPGGVAYVRPAVVAAPVPVARPIVAAPAVPVAVQSPIVVPGYAPFARSAILLGSNKGSKTN
uniref:Neuropeptide-like 4 n=1 Tax=Parastrongyloides trichosuri TaxID=131310 RepID=A0A0N4ZS73_PARTI